MLLPSADRQSSLRRPSDVCGRPGTSSDQRCALVYAHLLAKSDGILLLRALNSYSVPSKWRDVLNGSWLWTVTRTRIRNHNVLTDRHSFGNHEVQYHLTDPQWGEDQKIDRLSISYLGSLHSADPIPMSNSGRTEHDSRTPWPSGPRAVLLRENTWGLCYILNNFNTKMKRFPVKTANSGVPILCLSFPTQGLFYLPGRDCHEWTTVRGAKPFIYLFSIYMCI
jgi:hypothetical protein